MFGVVSFIVRESPPTARLEFEWQESNSVLAGNDISQNGEAPGEKFETRREPFGSNFSSFRFSTFGFIFYDFISGSVTRFDEIHHFGK